MSELGDAFRAMKRDRQRTNARRGKQARADFHLAEKLASAHGLVLRGHTDVHYTLMTKTGLERWELYPSNQRIYTDKAHRKATPFLKLHGGAWSLSDAVKAAAIALGKMDGREDQMSTRNMTVVCGWGDGDLRYVVHVDAGDVLEAQYVATQMILAQDRVPISRADMLFFYAVFEGHIGDEMPDSAVINGLDVINAHERRLP